MERIKSFIRRNFPDKTVVFLRNQKLKYRSYYYRNNINRLAEINFCDKWGKHYYTPHYKTHFEKFKKNKLNLLEIGIGGYKNRDKGGASLRLWKNYFRNGNIYGIDIYDKSLLEEKRIKTFQGSQTDIDFLNDVSNYIGDIDIIIDDGSHVNEDIINTFNYLFPVLKNGGIYIVEDLQCSYWPWYGGNSEEINDDRTAVNYFKGLVHGLNYKEFIKKDYKSNYFEKHIISIHFYHNMVFIYKGDNTESSSFLVENQIPVSN